MNKEQREEIVERLETAETYIVVTGDNNTAFFAAYGDKNDVANLFLNAIAEFVNGTRVKPRSIDNKQTICNLLLKTLQATDNARDLVSLDYDEEEETVTATFRGGGTREINVRMDSGTAMIRDIMKHLGC